MVSERSVHSSLELVKIRTRGGDETKWSQYVTTERTVLSSASLGEAENLAGSGPRGFRPYRGNNTAKLDIYAGLDI